MKEEGRTAQEDPTGDRVEGASAGVRCRGVADLVLNTKTPSAPGQNGRGRRAASDPLMTDSGVAAVGGPRRTVTGRALDNDDGGRWPDRLHGSRATGSTMPRAGSECTHAALPAPLPGPSSAPLAPDTLPRSRFLPRLGLGS